MWWVLMLFLRKHPDYSEYCLEVKIVKNPLGWIVFQWIQEILRNQWSMNGVNLKILSVIYTGGCGFETHSFPKNILQILIDSTEFI